MSKNPSLPPNHTNATPADTAVPTSPDRPLVVPDLLLEGGVVWDKYKLPIIGAVVLLIAALIGSEVYRSAQAKKTVAASALLNSAKTASEYQHVIDTYPGSKAAANAYLLSGREKMDGGDFAGAAQTWKTFVEKFPDHALAAVTLLGQGGAFEAQGKADEARAIYQRVATAYPGSYAAPLARLSEASLLKSQRKLEEARRIYEGIIAADPKGEMARQAEQELHYLHALPPPASADTGANANAAPTPAVPSETPTASAVPALDVEPIAPAASPAPSAAIVPVTAPTPQESVIIPAAPVIVPPSPTATASPSPTPAIPATAPLPGQQ